MTASTARQTSHDHNADQAELDKFSALASQWWDPNGKFRPLHDINPLRLALIDEAAKSVKGKRCVDIGCGGGLVSEGLARMGARVTGVDLASKALAVARLHALESSIAIDYVESSAEAMAEQHAGEFDVVTCLEMLEHVPDPASVVAACTRLAKPGAPVVVSTISRTPKAYTTAVLGAEYVLGLLPRGTHEYGKFIRPSELVTHARTAGLQLEELRGMDYNPFTHRARWITDTTVNYIAVFRKP